MDKIPNYALLLVTLLVIGSLSFFYFNKETNSIGSKERMLKFHEISTINNLGFKFEENVSNLYDTYKRPFCFEDANRLREPFHVTASPDGSKVSYGLGDTLWVKLTENSGKYQRILISTGISGNRLAGDPFIAWSPDGQFLAFQADPEGIVGRDYMAAPIFIAQFKRSELLTVERLLPDSNEFFKRVINTGNLGPVIATRWGGPVWSPDSRRLAFLGWPRNAESNPDLQLFVADIATDKIERWTDDTHLKTGLSWSPDGKWLALARVTNELSGLIELISTNDKFHRKKIIFEGDRFFGDLLWASDGKKLFVNTNQGSPFILYVTPDSITTLNSELPNGSYAGWTPDGSNLLASTSVGMGSRLSLIDPITGNIRHITGSDSLFNVSSIGGSSKKTLTVFTVESGDLPKDVWLARINVHEAKIDYRRQLTRVNQWLDSVLVAKSRVYRWKTSDNTLLSGQLLLPARYDSTYPLPLVVMPYGAYQNSFPGSGNFMTKGLQVLVSMGIAVVRPNTRGIASQQQSDGYGSVQLEDTHDLLDALRQDEIIDSKRVALLGHSHGGAMVYYYMSHSNRFAGGIAVNGAADWVFQAQRRDMTGLPWGLGGMPDELPEKYKLFSPLENAESVSAPLLAVAGGGDTQIPPHNSKIMVERLKSLGKPAKLMYLEDEDHWIHKNENIHDFWIQVFEFMQCVLQLETPTICK